MIKSTIEISASIMCINWLNVQADLDILIKEKIDYLHWDIIDGQFASDSTMGSSIINTLLPYSNIPSDYHLMVENPSRLFDSFQTHPGDIFTIHQESTRNLHRDIIKIRQMGLRVGVAISPGTSIETLRYVLEDLDIVLVMTVNPGFKGQKIIPQTISKINDLKQMINKYGLTTKIQVDGSVNNQYIPDMVAAGADILVGGSSGLFRKDLNLPKSIETMRIQAKIGLERRRGHCHLDLV